MPGETGGAGEINGTPYYTMCVKFNLIEEKKLQIFRGIKQRSAARSVSEN
jgi:hypothetical protein